MFHQIIGWKMLLIIGYLFSIMDWFETRNSWVLTNFCVFSSFLINMNFNISTSFIELGYSWEGFAYGISLWLEGKIGVCSSFEMHIHLI
jgi:hypothetical protein